MEDLKLYYSIGEVAERFGVNTSLIRFWENNFPHIKPTKNRRGERRFTKQNIAQLEQVYHLVRERGFTLEGAKKEIASGKKPDAEKEEIMAALRAVRAKLASLKK